MIYIHKPAVDDKNIGECKYCGTRFNCVPVDIDALHKDYNDYKLECLKQGLAKRKKLTVKPFSEYLSEHM